MKNLILKWLAGAIIALFVLVALGALIYCICTSPNKMQMVHLFSALAAAASLLWSVDYLT